ncbi:MAG: aldehyde dehydrogenase family protein, partial [Parvibaculaceae bacterium]
MAAAEDYRTRIAQVSYRNQAFINGRFTAAASGKTFDCISPIDGQALTKVAECDKVDVARAVTAARAVFEKGTWAQMAPAQRKRILLKWVALIEKH